MKKEQLAERIIVLKDPRLNLEKNSIMRNILNVFFIPIINLLPVGSRNLIKKTNDSVKEVIDNATSHKALEILYNNGYPFSIKKLYKKMAHSVWFNTNNSKAVRNRLRIVKDQLVSIIKEQALSMDEINIVSIAAGSARAVVEALNEVCPDSIVNVVFVDKSQEALSYSENLIKSLKLDSNKKYSFIWVNDTVNGFLDKNSKKFSVVEMVGLMDYFDDEKALSVFKKIYETLIDGGTFITANINDNRERVFVTKAIGWPMIYRTAEHLAFLVYSAGFPHERMILYYEPYKIHSIIIAER